MYLKTAKAEPQADRPSSGAQGRAQAPWAKLRKYLAVGSIAVLAQSGAILLLAEAERRRRRNDQIIRRLVQRINQVREEEQRHIARELHDNIGQRLSLLSIQLGSLRNPRTKSLGSADTAELVLEVDDLITEVHNLSHRLHSSKLEYLGLEDAVAEMCRDISRQQNIDIKFKLDGTPGLLSPEISLCFYRVVQEALNNVVKHSGAVRAEVALTSMGDRLMIQICDDGSGFDTKATCYGLGLASMEERILSVHGKLFVFSNLGEGTSIIAEAPVNVSRLDYESSSAIPALGELASHATQPTIL